MWGFKQAINHNINHLEADVKFERLTDTYRVHRAEEVFRRLYSTYGTNPAAGKEEKKIT